MQYSIATAISTILFASALTSAVAIPQQQQPVTEINIQMKTGSGDASVGREVLKSDFGFLLTEDSNGSSLTGVALRMSTQGVTCGVFDPKTGRAITKNNSFDFVSEVPFGKGGSTGEVDSSEDDAIPVAICCDLKSAFLKSCAAPKPKATKGNNNGGAGSAAGSQTTTPPPPPPTATSKPPPKNNGNGKFFPVEMILSGLDELAVPGAVLADGKPHPVRNAVGIQKIEITKQHGPVECRAFADEAGKKPVGNVFDVKKTGVDFINFDFPKGVDVNAVACRAISR